MLLFSRVLSVLLSIVLSMRTHTMRTQTARRTHVENTHITDWGGLRYNTWLPRKESAIINMSQQRSKWHHTYMIVLCNNKQCTNDDKNMMTALNVHTMLHSVQPCTCWSWYLQSARFGTQVFLLHFSTFSFVLFACLLLVYLKSAEGF